MSAWLQDRWFALACGALAFALMFLLAAADTAGVVPFESFKVIAEWFWKFFVGAAAGLGLQKIFRAQAAQRQDVDGGNPASGDGKAS